jgi:hypothetical protein
MEPFLFVQTIFSGTADSTAFSKKPEILDTVTAYGSGSYDFGIQKP